MLLWSTSILHHVMHMAQVARCCTDPQRSAAVAVMTICATLATAPHRPTCLQGDMRWDAQRTGDTATDWPLLHSISCSNPDIFWTAVLAQLRIQFSTPPMRILQDNPQQPDQVRWLPGGCNMLRASSFTLSGVVTTQPKWPHCLCAVCCITIAVATINRLVDE